MDSRAPQNSEATDESPLVCESVWFAQQLYEDAEANYHVHLQTSQDGQNGLLDPSNLIFTIDGQKKSFDAWTLEYANTDYPNLGKEVIKIPCLDFTPSSASVKQLRVKQNDAKPNSSEHQETPPPPPCTQRKTKKERKKEKAEKGTPIPGAYELEEPDEDKVRGLKAERIVRESFEQLGKELGSLVMIAGYNFDSYLSKLRKDMTQRGLSPTRASEIMKNKEMDLLVLREDSGPLLIEVKSFCPDNSKEDHVKRELSRLREQLSLDKQIFDHIMKDLPDPPRVTKICALPNVSRHVLSRVYGSRKIDEDTFILCREELQGRTSDHRPSSLRHWWDETIVPRNNSVSLETIKRMVGRIAGLLSTVSVPTLDKKRMEIRTSGEAAREAGRQTSLVMLTKQQADILNCPDSCVQIRGPPGSGKTLLLALKAKRWLDEGDTVFLDEGLVEKTQSFALKRLIENLCLNSCCDVSNLLRVFSSAENFRHKEKVAELTQNIDPGKVHVILDDFFLNTSEYTERILQNFVSAGISVWWVLACTDAETKVSNVKTFTLSKVLRSPPVIQRLLTSIELVPEWQQYYIRSSEDVGQCTDGPPIRLIHHSSHVPCIGVPPSQCERCAVLVAEVLSALGVAPAATGSDCELSSSSNAELKRLLGDSTNRFYCTSKHNLPIDSCTPPAVRNSDIIILKQTPVIRETFLMGEQDDSQTQAQIVTDYLSHDRFQLRLPGDQSDEPMQDLPPSCVYLRNDDDFLKRIRALSGIPLATRCGNLSSRRLTALSSDHTVVTYEKYSWGLERQVVVFVMTPDENPLAPDTSSTQTPASAAGQNAFDEITHTDKSRGVVPVPPSPKILPSAIGLDVSAQNKDVDNFKHLDDSSRAAESRSQVPLSAELPTDASHVGHAGSVQDSALNVSATCCDREKKAPPEVEDVYDVPQHYLERLTPHQRSMLYVAASRCQSVLIIVFP